MGEKSNQSSGTIWPPIIGVIGIVLGATLGFLGAQAGARAQIEAAKINIYGPIYTTQTAEARGLIIPATAVLSVSPENQLTPVPIQEILPVENIAQYIFAYDGRANGLNSYSYLRLFYSGIDAKPYYVLDYNLPEGQTGYAGISFQFHNGQNVSSYRAIEFSIQFAGANVPIDLFMRDISGQKSSIRIVSTGTEVINLQYDLDIFKDVDFNALKEIGFNSDDTFSSGDHTVVIHDIRFVR